MFCYFLGQVLCRPSLPATQEPRRAARQEGQAVPTASRARIPPLVGSRLGLPSLRPPRRQEIPAALLQHLCSHTRWEGPSARSPPACCHPGAIQQQPNHPQLQPNASQAGIFIVSKRFKCHLLGKHFSCRRRLREDDLSTRSSLCLPGSTWASLAVQVCS